MQKIIKFTVLIICLVIYLVSVYQPVSDKWELYKITHSGIFSSDRYVYGDLYGMSHLSYFRKQYQPDTPVVYADCEGMKNIDLYAESDSYVWPLFTIPNYFCCVNKLTYVKNKEGYIIARLDTSKVNVLLLEFSERNVLRSLTDSTYVNNLVNIRNIGKASKYYKNIPEKSKLPSLIFNNTIGDNLAYNVWDYSFFRPVKELKADLDYHLFHNTDVNVAISKDGKQLYYNTTIDTTDIVSAFRFITDEEKNNIIASLNRIYDNAKQYGFDRVYLTLVPNPVSILDPHFNGLHYNNLLNRVQNDPNLKMPFINLWPRFMQLQRKVYQKSDSHWNRYGANIWLQKFNAELAGVADKAGTRK